MVHIDLNPVEVTYEFRTVEVPARYNRKKLVEERQRRAVVWAYNVRIHEEPWTADVYSSDDWLDGEWRNKWEQFLGESFKRWTNEPRTEEQEDRNSGD